MRKTFTQCCLAVLIAPVLTFMLIGTIALAASGGSLTLNESVKTLEKGETVTLTATAAGAAGGANITWSTDNGNAVELSATTGATVTVTAKEVSAESKARVTATCEYTYKDDTSTSQTVKLEETCTITVKAPVVTAPTVTDIRITEPNVTTPPLTMSSGDMQRVTVVTTPANSKYTWSTSDRSVAVVENGNIRAVGPGEATLTVTANDNPDVNDSVDVMVRGFKKLKDSATIKENGSVSLSDLIETFGTTYNDLTIWSNKPTVAEVVGNEIKGKSPGTATITATAKSGNFSVNFMIEVEADGKNTIDAGTIRSTETLRFSTLYSDFSEQAGGELDHIMGLSVDTKKGTLFYNYISEDVPNIGVGDSAYYRSPTVGQRGISDITFVPKRDFAGGEVVINYTAVSKGNQNYRCRITLTVDPGTGTTADISLTTKYNTPVQFDANEFDRVCKERTGSRLDYVIFAQPPTRQGTLYTNYSASGNYGSVVSTTAQYSLRSLDDIWFVPAPGYTGPVTVYYTGHSVGTPGSSYAGQITITVGEDTGVAIGGVSYETSKGGVVYLDDRDFDNYCQERLDDSHTLNHLRFNALPSASEGVLYYDYRSSTNTGSPAAAGTPYYNGTRNPRIDRLAFVPAADFVGTVRIPFTAQTTNGDTFSGDAIINVRGGTAVGDIQYTCAPGRSVSFDDTHFNRLSRDATGSSLNYIEFQSLPSGSDGTLYYNSSTARTGTRYYNGSSSPRIDNLSFRASSSFSGVVNIPFVGRATNGESFNGVVTVSSSGSGSRGDSIRYTTDSKSAAVFDRDDFDDLSQWETDRSISSVRFEIPSSSQGYLYRNYRSSSSMGTRLTSTTTITASDLDRVAFVPASGYTGTVYIDFRGTASGSGGTFDGTVEIEVGRAQADNTASYSTRIAPVRLNSSDLGRRGSTLSSVRFTAMPPAGTGYLYYQYVSPTHYGQQANTGTTYRVSGSNLISDLSFVPRAGYSGTVTIPYIGTNSNGTTFEGEVFITVTPGYGSTYFSDMSGYSPAQQAAVDFLYDHNVTRGLAQGQYGPESHIRRGDFARMVYQAFELSPVGTTNAFSDVPAGAYYAEAVNALYARGVVSGVGGGRYSPDSALTRQDAICMVQRAMRTVGWSANDGYTGALAGYSDGDSVSGYAQGAMSFAVQRGYLPTTGGRLSPTQPLTRVDMAEIIHRVLTY